MGKGGKGRSRSRSNRGRGSPSRGREESPLQRKKGSPSRSRSRSDSKAKDSKPSKPKIRGETVDVTFDARPFGMGPSKDESEPGYVVEKVAEGKPAANAGVQKEWKIVEVGGKSTLESSSKEVQDLLKNCDLPVKVVFEKPSLQLDTDSEEDDLLNQRAETRNQHAASLANIDDLPVHRDPEGLPEPIKDWQEACDRGYLNVALVKKLQGAGLKRPTLIQRHAIPILGHGPETYDMLGQAQTGSGKTFAFVIPIVARCVIKGATPRPFFAGQCSQISPVILILSPTRELAQQTSQEITVLLKGTNLSHMAIYGGESNADTLRKIDKTQVDIMCGTPGRLVTLNDQAKLSLGFVETVILDEADQMLENRLEFICETILVSRDMMTPAMGRQTVLFSATMPQKIRDMVPNFTREARLTNLTIGNYGSDGKSGGSCESIKQIIRFVHDDQQRVSAMIQDLYKLWDKSKGRVVVFTNMRTQADNIQHALKREGMSCHHLHGKLDQEVRTEVFDKFRRGLFDVLVATNLASRGLDFPDIALVVQYNVHEDIDIYTHRVGRTGRAGQVGTALSYVGHKDKRLFPKLADFLKLNNQDVPDFLEPQERRGDRGDRGDRGYRGDRGDRGDRGGRGDRGDWGSSRGGYSREPNYGRRS